MRFFCQTDQPMGEREVSGVSIPFLPTMDCPLMRTSLMERERVSTAVLGTPDRNLISAMRSSSFLHINNKGVLLFFFLFFSEACRILEYFRVRFRQTGRGAFLSLSHTLSHTHTSPYGKTRFSDGHW